MKLSVAAEWGSRASSSSIEGISSLRYSRIRKAVSSSRAATAALRLGKLESRNGEFDRAEATLKKAISLNAANARARAEAYVALAQTAGARGDWKSAVAYATVVTSLFDDPAYCDEAKKIIKDHSEAKE